MVLVNGPMFSLGASGTIGDTLVFSIWKGRAYVRQRVIPTNPKSASQTGMRAMWSFLSKQWTNLFSPDQATFDADAESKSISPFNSYMAMNMDRWKNYLPPAQTFVPAEASAATAIATMTLNGGEAHVNVEVTPAESSDVWGIEIYRDLAEITDANNSNCVYILEGNGNSMVEFNDTGLDPGTYHYRSAVINTDGIRGAVKADATAVVT